MVLLKNLWVVIIFDNLPLLSARTTDTSPVTVQHHCSMTSRHRYPVKLCLVWQQR